MRPVWREATPGSDDLPRIRLHFADKGYDVAMPKEKTPFRG